LFLFYPNPTVKAFCIFHYSSSDSSTRRFIASGLVRCLDSLRAEPYNPGLIWEIAFETLLRHVFLGKRKAKTMDVKQFILEFQHSEKIKSHLIISSTLLAHVEALKGEDRSGAEKVFKTYLQLLLTEIRIARNTVKSVNYHGAEKNLTESLRMLEMNDLVSSNLYISKALSYITTSCEAAMTSLQKHNLL
jgi:hypothetical protein